MTTIVDYGLGNLGSIRNMLLRLGEDSVESSDPQQIVNSERLILPGVGSFDEGMGNIIQFGLLDALNSAVLERQVPILGICLGFQLLGIRSDEGKSPGLGWLDAETVSLKSISGNTEHRVPHMGWDSIEVVGGQHLFQDIADDPRFYFVHSFGIRPSLPIAQQYAISRFERSAFVSAAGRGNIMGVQFHPEKSHHFGMKLMKNFCSMSVDI